MNVEDVHVDNLLMKDGGKCDPRIIVIHMIFLVRVFIFHYDFDGLASWIGNSNRLKLLAIIYNLVIQMQNVERVVFSSFFRWRKFPPAYLQLVG